MVLQRTILVVEDSPVQAIVLRRVLAHAGYTVIIAKDGQEGFEAAKRQPPGLIISDINMPRMNGFELCRAIKNDPTLRHIPVILSTALSSPNDLLVGIEVGANNYIPHPWNEKQLLFVVDELLKAPPRPPQSTEVEIVTLRGKDYHLTTSRQYILNFLLSTYENIHLQNQELSELKEEIQAAYKKLESAQKEQEEILHNIFPIAVAQELMAYGSVSARRYENVSVMFMDFVGFTKSSREMSPQVLVEALGIYFEKFDSIISNNLLERIKTIGDGYMCVGGVPEELPDNAVLCVNAAIEIIDFMNSSAAEMKAKYNLSWQIRIGIHTGPVVAGVIGKKRPAYDIWGGTVNFASRMESHSEKNRINISEETYEGVKHAFNITARGKVPVKNKEGIEMELNMFFIDSKK